MATFFRRHISFQSFTDNAPWVGAFGPDHVESRLTKIDSVGETPHSPITHSIVGFESSK